MSTNNSFGAKGLESKLGGRSYEIFGLDALQARTTSRGCRSR